MANDPLDSTRYTNIAYSVHFYAATHKQWNRDMVQQAIDKNLPIFASECGLSEANGDGSIDVGEFNIWISFLESNSIGWVVWGVDDKEESSAALKPGASTNGGWVASRDLTPGGLVAYNLIRSKQGDKVL